MVQYSPITDKIKAAIRERISPESIISAPDLLDEYASDASSLHYTPELVVRAASVRAAEDRAWQAPACRRWVGWCC